jgi:hypothetical protein
MSEGCENATETTGSGDRQNPKVADAASELPA